MVLVVVEVVVPVVVGPPVVVVVVVVVEVVVGPPVVVVVHGPRYRQLTQGARSIMPSLP